jgi:PAS domain S-box-containing protein
MNSSKMTTAIQGTAASAALDDIDVGVCMVSDEEVVLLVNADWCRLFDCAETAWLGRPLETLLCEHVHGCRGLIEQAKAGARISFDYYHHGHLPPETDCTRCILQRVDIDGASSALMLTTVANRPREISAATTGSDPILDIAAQPALTALLLESVTDVIFSFDKDWRYTYLNTAAERFLGQERHQLVGRPCWDIFPHLEQNDNARRGFEAMRERKFVTWQAQSSLTGLWMQWRVYPMTGGGVAVFVEKIDSRVHMEEALRASEKRFRALADLVPAFIWTNDPEGRSQWRNQRWVDFSGIGGDADVTTADLLTIHPEDRAQSLALLQNAFTTETSLRCEHRVRRADGEYRWTLAVAQPIRDDRGIVVQWVGVAIDVQDQKDALEAERAARAEAEQARIAAENAREHLRNMVAAIPTPIVVTRGRDHVYEMVNPAYLALVGGRQLLGKPMAEVFPYVAANGFLEILQRVQATGEEITLQERPVVYDRERNGVMYEGYFTSYLAPLRNSDGTIGGVVTSGVEVTDQVHQRARVQALRDEAEAARAQLLLAHAQLEERIRARTIELAGSNAALATEIEVRKQAETARTDLLRRLATAQEDAQRRTARDLHDQVGQTLSALMLAIRAACDAEPIPHAAAARLDDALRLAEDLGRDIHDLATRLRPAVLDDIGLHAALRQLVGDYTRRYGAVLDFQAAWLQWERLPADLETLLYRVVQEALTNVARHARACRISVVVERHSGDVIAIVEDDGVGFDPSATAQGRLGLVGMRERVMLAGGTLEIESGPGEGTTVIARVSVNLPGA